VGAINAFFNAADLFVAARNTETQQLFEQKKQERLHELKLLIIDIMGLSKDNKAMYNAYEFDDMLNIQSTKDIVLLDKSISAFKNKIKERTENPGKFKIDVKEVVDRLLFDPDNKDFQNREQEEYHNELTKPKSGQSTIETLSVLKKYMDKMIARYGDEADMVKKDLENYRKILVNSQALGEHIENLIGSSIPITVDPLFVTNTRKRRAGLSAAVAPSTVAPAAFPPVAPAAFPPVAPAAFPPVAPSAFPPT
jgi:hypothetical protein